LKLLLVAENELAFFRDVRRRLDATGRNVRFLFGIYGVSKEEDLVWKQRGIDWRRLVREKIIDGLVITAVKPDKKRPIESTKEIYEFVAKDCGSCPFYCPVSAYTFQKSGIANYAEWLGVSKAEATRRLLALARDVGAAGILMECVDYRNYSPEMCEALNAR
jgi:ferredoxin